MVTADRAALFAAAATPYHCHSAGDTGGSERYCQRAGRLWRSAFLFPPDCPAQDGGAFLNGDCQHVCKHYGLHIVAQSEKPRGAAGSLLPYSACTPALGAAYTPLSQRCRIWINQAMRARNRADSEAFRHSLV